MRSCICAQTDFITSKKEGILDAFLCSMLVKEFSLLFYE